MQEDSKSMEQRIPRGRVWPQPLGGNDPTHISRFVFRTKCQCCAQSNPKPKILGDLKSPEKKDFRHAVMRLIRAIIASLKSKKGKVALVL